jgi:formylglycine-generating enzyme required for sulfatase activity
MTAAVFISYASKDRKVASSLCDALENRGFPCWVAPRDVRPGENFQEAIVQAIRQAKVMVLVFSGNANNSVEVTKELALASQHRLVVIPVRVEDVVPSDAFAYEFATRQWIDLFDGWEQAVARLSKQVESVLAASQPMPGAAAGALSGTPAGAPAAAGTAPIPAVASPPPPRRRWVMAAAVAVLVLGASGALAVYVNGNMGPKPLGAAQERAMAPKQVFKECPTCPEMVVVPAGSFMMGAADSAQASPPHLVTLARPFAAGRFAVTFDEWDACVADGGCAYRAYDRDWGRGRLPVINVSWNDAKTYVTWLARKTGKPYRLLSEAEREYVTRAGATTPFWWGATISSAQANYDGTNPFGAGPVSDWRRKTVPVDNFDPNPFGLYQVHGNVRDWVEDCWNDSYVGAPADGSAWMSGNCKRRVLRGTSWFDKPADAAFRDENDAAFRYHSFGFRVARALAP